MEEDEEKKEKKDDSRIIDKVRSGAMKARNVAQKVKAIIKAFIAAPTIVKVAVVVLLGVAVLASTSKLLNLFGDNSISYVASSKIMQNDVQIAKASDEEGYYFRINKNVVWDYIKKLDQATSQGYYLDREPENDDDDDSSSNKSNSGSSSSSIGDGTRFSSIKSDVLFQKMILEIVF